MLVLNEDENVRYLRILFRNIAPHNHMPGSWAAVRRVLEMITKRGARVEANPPGRVSAPPRKGRVV
jgi:hypothetical protein